MRRMSEKHAETSITPGSSRARVAVLRACAAGGMALAFVLVASLIEPGASRASERSVGVVLPDGVTRDVPAAFLRVDADSDLGRSLGALHGRRYTVEVVAGRGGEPATYRVLNADGAIVADGLREEEMYSVDPDLTIDRMGDYPETPRDLPGALMLLDASRE